MHSCYIVYMDNRNDKRVEKRLDALRSPLVDTLTVMELVGELTLTQKMIQTRIRNLIAEIEAASDNMPEDT